MAAVVMAAVVRVAVAREAVAMAVVAMAVVVRAAVAREAVVRAAVARVAVAWEAAATALVALEAEACFDRWASQPQLCERESRQALQQFPIANFPSGQWEITGLCGTYIRL
jgi:hypothetical protein